MQLLNMAAYRQLAKSPAIIDSKAYDLLLAGPHAEITP
jgi:hypothetical protein